MPDADGNFKGVFVPADAWERVFGASPIDTKGARHVMHKPWFKDRRYTEVWVSEDGRSWRMLGMEGPPDEAW